MGFGLMAFGLMAFGLMAFGLMAFGLMAFGLAASGKTAGAARPGVERLGVERCRLAAASSERILRCLIVDRPRASNQTPILPGSCRSAARRGRQRATGLGGRAATSSPAPC
jgi:hypothetical protein